MLVLEASTGRFIQEIDMQGLGAIVGIEWCDTQPHLVVWVHNWRDKKEEISYFKIT